jgi:hypothetical protein
LSVYGFWLDYKSNRSYYSSCMQYYHHMCQKTHEIKAPAQDPLKHFIFPSLGNKIDDD